MTDALHTLIEVLRRSRLLSEEELNGHLDRFDQQATAQSPERLASWLVDAGALTAWQATKLLQGKHRGFFLGRYKLLKLIGKGGMSSVYQAEHQVLRNLCAIKVLPPKLVHNQGFLQRFHREARAGAALSHPNIVRSLDVDHVVDGNHEIHFLVMEYVEGRNLYDLVASGGPLPAQQAADFMRQAALGLAHAHAAGIVHRDVKPGNFLLTKDGQVKLTDLGLARLDQPDHEHSLTVQYDQKVLGTADYLAPEQAVDSHRVDPRADLYSLGCTFHFLLTGEPPFPEGTLTQRLIAHQTQPPPDISARRPDVPRTLSRIVQQLLAKKPADRLQSAAITAKLLTRWLETGGAAEVAEPQTTLPAEPIVPSKNAQIASQVTTSQEDVRIAAPTGLSVEDARLAEFLRELQERPPVSYVRGANRKRPPVTVSESPPAPQPNSDVLGDDEPQPD